MQDSVSCYAAYTDLRVGELLRPPISSRQSFPDLESGFGQGGYLMLNLQNTRHLYCGTTLISHQNSHFVQRK